MQAFELLAFTESGLFSALSNAHCPAELVGDKNEIAQYLFRYLAEMRATSIVVEHNYVDSDYLDDHSVFYAKCFMHYTNRTKRLHFFSGPELSEGALRSGILASNPEQSLELSSNYLGFVVARPLPLAVIGRTVLRPYPSDNGRRNYLATKIYRANLFGLPLQVQSLAFQQQDRALAACATVALWSCFHKTAELYATTAPTPAFITRSASVAVQGRSMPSQGLEFHQMCEAVRGVGLEPEVYRPSAGLPLASLIYSYLRMGQPVILGVNIAGLGAHAITVSGYSMTTTRCLQMEAGLGQTPSVPLKGEWIDELYVHDDQAGPFARLTLSNPTTPDKPVEMKCSKWTMPDGSLRPITAFAVLIPVCSAIRIGFNEIFAFAKQLNVLIDTGPTSDLVWDIFLSESNTYKEQIRTLPDSEIPSLEDILFMSHPRYIWCSRLTSSEGMRIEVLHDATNVYGSLSAYAIRWGSAALKQMTLDRLTNHRDVVRQALGSKVYDWLRSQAE